MKNETVKVEPKKVQRFVLYSIPSRKPFVISCEKAEEFKKQHTSHSDSEFVKNLAEIFKNNNLIGEGPGPVLKKVKKTNPEKTIRK